MRFCSCSLMEGARLWKLAYVISKLRLIREIEGSTAVIKSREPVNDGSVSRC